MSLQAMMMDFQKRFDVIEDDQMMRRIRLLPFAMVTAVAMLAASGISHADKPNPEKNNMAELIKTDVVVGEGAEAKAGMTVEVHYTGWLYDESVPDNKGSQFDSSRNRMTFDFPLGAGRVIKGWDQGVEGMKVGGQRTLVIPPELGYGARGAGSVIPPNAALIFDVELLGVR